MSIVGAIILIIQSIEVTNNYLKFESIIVMKVIDTYFDEKPVPDIAYSFNHLFPISQKFINEVKILKKKYGNNSFENEFQALFFEINSFIDCEIRTEGIYKKCHSIRYPTIYSLISDEMMAKILHNSFKKKYNLLNETLMEEISKYSRNVMVKYPQFPSKNTNNNKKYSQKIFSLDKSYWKKNSIIRFSTKFKEVSDKTLYLTFNKNFRKIQYSLENLFQWNKDYFLTKKLFEFLGTPYKSSCSYYDRNETIFNSFSNEHCVQQCIRYHCKVNFNCSCAAAFFNSSAFLFINELDDGSIKTPNCSSEGLQNSLRKYSNFCAHLCPNDCIIDEYIVTEKYNNGKLYSYPNRSEITIQWDDSKPLILNKETSVMTFNEYFCYIGGLFGMWFGIGANQLIDKLKENYLIYYRNLIDFGLTLFYTSLEIIFIIKIRFLSIIRH